VLRGEQPGGEHGREHAAVRRRRLGMPLPASRGERDVDAAPVLAAQAALDKPMPLQPVDQPGQRALAQVHGVGQFLGTEVTVPSLREAVKNLELADTEPVPLTQFVLERGTCRRMAGRDGPPDGYHWLRAVSRSRA